MIKISRSDSLELVMMAGRKESPGILHARELGIEAVTDGIYPILERDDIKIVFDCTSAAAHFEFAPLFKQAGKVAIDLTPAAVGPYVVPCVNLEEHMDSDNLNMVTCGGQATSPIMYAINRAADVEYGEIVSAISSRSAGPGTRANIDEFTETTARALQLIGGADKGKAIIILNPAEPPCLMTNTIYAKVRKPDLGAITDSINDIVAQLKSYVPGYTLRVPPILDGDKVTVIIQVEGNGDFLPKYSGNLDIINAAAIAVGEKLATRMKGV